MNCNVHKETPAIGTCVGCGKFICSDCCTELKGKNYCKPCLEEEFTKREKAIERLEDNKQQPTVFMNSGGGGGGSSSSSSSASAGLYHTKKSFSWFWFIFWLIVFFPIAIVYWIVRR